MAEFDQAAQRVRERGQQDSNAISQNDALILYGLYKQALFGDVNIDRPGITDQAGQAKWDAWNSRKGLSADDAKAQYVAEANRVLG